MIIIPSQPLREAARLVNRAGGISRDKAPRGANGPQQALAMVLGFALVCCFASTCATTAAEAALQHVTLHVGFTRSSFRNVNASDATAAFRVFAQTAARKRGYLLETDARLFDDPASCEADIKKGDINLAILDTWDYLGMDLEAVMDPVFVHLEQGSVLKDYLLLTRRASGVSGLTDLRGKDLMVLEGKGGNLSRAWLDSLLRAEHLEAKETFFHKLEPVAKPSGAVLPVFFGTKAACLVDRAAFQIMTELNPQVGSNVAVTAASDRYLENITCASKRGWPSERTRQDLIQVISELHIEPSGRQILELFKLDRMVPFKEEYLDTARKLRAASDPARQRNLATLPDRQIRRDP